MNRKLGRRRHFGGNGRFPETQKVKKRLNSGKSCSIVGQVVPLKVGPENETKYENTMESRSIGGFYYKQRM